MCTCVWAWGGKHQNNRPIYARLGPPQLLYSVSIKLNASSGLQMGEQPMPRAGLAAPCPWCQHPAANAQRVKARPWAGPHGESQILQGRHRFLADVNCHYAQGQSILLGKALCALYGCSGAGAALNELAAEPELHQRHITPCSK